MNSKMILVLSVGLVIAYALYKFVPDDLSPMQRSVHNELLLLDFKDVDVKELPTAKLGELNVLLFSGKSPAELKGGVQAILDRDT